LLEALFGDITNVTLSDALTAVVISIVAMALTRIIYSKLVLSMISEELATSTGVNVARTNLLYLLLVSLIVAVGIEIVGTLLVGFLVIVPAATAKNVSSNLNRYSLLSSALGAVTAFSGIILSSYLSQPAGPLVVLSGIVVFIVTITIKWASK